MKSKFISSIDSNEKRTMYSSSDSNIVMIGIDTDKIIQELFDSLLHKYQIGPEQSMKGSNFSFDYGSGMYYQFNKVKLNRGGSHIDSPKCMTAVSSMQ